MALAVPLEVNRSRGRKTGSDSDAGESNITPPAEDKKARL